MLIFVGPLQVVRLASNTDAPEESRQTLVSCHLNISMCFLKEGDAENALLHSTQVTMPPFPPLCQQLPKGRVRDFTFTSNPKPNALRQVLRIDPDNPKVLYRHASALVGMGQPEEARHSLAKADAVKPGDASITGLLREVDAKMGKPAEDARPDRKKPSGDDGPAPISAGGDASLRDKADATLGDLRSGAEGAAGGGDGVTKTCVTLATKMKGDGNDLFKKGMYAAAIEEYRDAIEMLTRPGVDQAVVGGLLAQCRNNAAASAVKSR